MFSELLIIVKQLLRVESERAIVRNAHLSATRFVESVVGVGGIVVAVFGVIDAYIGRKLKVFEERKVGISLHSVSVAAVGRYVQQVVLQRCIVQENLSRYAVNGSVAVVVHLSVAVVQDVAFAIAQV